MYIALYKNDPNSTFTPPVTTPSSSNYLQVHEGSRGSLWKCQRFQNNIGTGSWYISVDPPGTPVNACQPDPPTGSCSIGDVCGGNLEPFGDVYYYCQQASPTYTYYWELDTPGLPFITFGGLVRDVSEELTRRVYDLDTAKFEGLSDDLLAEPLVFVLKEDDGTYVYSGYVNSWSQDGKVVKFKGVDFKSIFDSEINLDFYADSASVNLQVTTIFNKVFEQFSSHPELNFSIPMITTDTTYIANLLGQVFTVKALQFLKVYLATFGLLIYPVFNEVTKEIDVSIVNNPEAVTIRLEDFVHTSSKTDTKTNKCIATIKLNQDPEEDTTKVQWIRSTKAYYDSLPSDRKSSGEGIVVNETNFIRFPYTNYTYSDYITPSGTTRYLTFTVYEANDDFKKILNNWSKKFILHIPYHPNISFENSRMSENGGASAYFNNTKQRYSTPPDIAIHPYTDFGQGWFIVELKSTYPVPYAYFQITFELRGINSTSQLGDAFRIEMANKVMFAPQNQFEEVYPYEFGKSFQEQPWYMKPKISLDYSGDIPPYGRAYRTHYVSFDQTFTAESGMHTLATYLGSCPVDISKISVYLNGNLTFDGNRQYGAMEFGDIINCEGNILFGFQGGEQFYFYTDNTYINDYHPWTLRIVISEVDVYWQLGQVPRRPRPVPKIDYYLGKDNEIYEEKINPANQIFPIKQRIVAEEFFYKAQFNAVYELVNSRYNENIIVLDNKNVNPLELSVLDLNAKVTVYDRQNSVAILPVSEIEIRNGAKRVKLGFKKTLFTEVIKS